MRVGAMDTVDREMVTQALQDVVNRINDVVDAINERMGESAQSGAEINVDVMSTLANELAQHAEDMQAMTMEETWTNEDNEEVWG